MFHLRNLYEYVSTTGQTNLYGFPFFKQERTKLTKAIFLTSQTYHLKSPPQWNQEQIIAVMEALVNTKSVFLIYEDVCEKHGRLVVDSMIKHNLLQLCPTRYCSFDLPNQPEHQEIVTAESVCGRIAMEDVVKRFK